MGWKWDKRGKIRAKLGVVWGTIKSKVRRTPL